MAGRQHRQAQLLTGSSGNYRGMGAFTHLGRWVIFPPNAPVLGHVFWKHFRKFLNQQAFKFLHGVNLPLNLLIFSQSPLQALFGVELGIPTLIDVSANNNISVTANSTNLRFLEIRTKQKQNKKPPADTPSRGQSRNQAL